MKIETVAILGAGAIGSYFIYGFSAAPDIDFCLIAKGERKERLEKEGLCINDNIYKPKERRSVGRVDRNSRRSDGAHST